MEDNKPTPPAPKDNQNLAEKLTKRFKELRSFIQSGEMPKAGCDKCDGGRIRIQKEFGWDTKMCDCYTDAVTTKKQLEYLQDSNVTEAEVLRYSIEDYDEHDMTLKNIASFSAQTGKMPWAYLHGGPGTGKTYTATIATLFAIALGKTALYVNVPELLDVLRPGRELEGKSWMELCRKADVLILDDIGQEKGSAWVSERLYLLVNTRYRDGKPTMFTSNFTLEELATRINPAVVSRIRQMAVTLPFLREDQRKPVVI